MSKALKFAGVVLTGALLAAPAAMFAQGPPPPPPPGGYYQDHSYYQGGWDQPPFNRQIQRNAFHDGLYGAEQDLKNRRSPNVRNRDEFRHYNGPEPGVYRQAFKRGYQSFWSHYRNGSGYPGY